MAEITMQDYELPHNQEAEKAVIGCILQDKRALVSAAEIINQDDFYFDANREIFSVAMELFNENSPVDIVTVNDRLARHDKLDAVGGITYLSALATSISTTENAAYYAKIIREKAVLRKLSKAANAINTMAVSQSSDSAVMLERAEQIIFDVAEDRDSTDIVPISDIMMSTYQDMVENAQNPGQLTGLDTGFDELNRKCGGLHGGEFILIAGRPAMGKSSFAVNIAETAAIRDGKTVAIFNLEMPKEALLKRIMCSQAHIESQKLLSGNIDSNDWISLGRIVDKLALAPLYINDSPVITVAEIKAKCHRLKQSNGLSLVIIDYLQLMQSGSKAESRQQAVADISRSLKVMAKELDVPVIALSQLSRACESRTDKRPMLSDIRESGSIEQDADIVMFLYRDEYYNPDTDDKNVAEVILAKHRAGETGTIKLGWRGQYTKFINIDYKAQEEP